MEEIRTTPKRVPFVLPPLIFPWQVLPLEFREMRYDAIANQWMFEFIVYTSEAFGRVVWVTDESGEIPVLTRKLGGGIDLMGIEKHCQFAHDMVLNSAKNGTYKEKPE